MDAMSDAIDHAAVMCYGVSLACKSCAATMQQKQQHSTHMKTLMHDR
eukprot:COSAG02_NODE_9112_length_2326_cov_1.163000_2_plen_47_part_00